MILIAGGTGTLGTKLLDRLLTRGLPVRILARNPARSSYPVSPPVEMVQGDVRDPASLLRAMTGVDTVVSAVHGFTGSSGNSPRSVDFRGNANLIDAASPFRFRPHPGLILTPGLISHVVEPPVENDTLLRASRSRAARAAVRVGSDPVRMGSAGETRSRMVD